MSVEKESFIDQILSHILRLLISETIYIYIDIFWFFKNDRCIYRITYVEGIHAILMNSNIMAYSNDYSTPNMASKQMSYYWTFSGLYWGIFRAPVNYELFGQARNECKTIAYLYISVSWIM